MKRLFFGLLLMGCASLSLAQSPSSQPPSQPASVPAAPVSLAVSEPASAAHCEECIVPLPAKPAYITAGVLGIGGLLGVRASMPALDSSPGVVLGAASLVGLNGAIGALGVARHRQTQKARPLYLAAMTSGVSVGLQFLMAMGIAWGADSETDEEVSSTRDEAVAISLLGAASAVPISGGLLVKAAQATAMKARNKRAAR